MKVIDIMINPSYSCNVCNKTFRVKEELNLNFLVICSKKCEFMFIYRLIQKQGYTIDNIKQLLKCIEKDKGMENKTSHFLIYELTKYYHKIGLSNIKHLGSRLNALAQGSEKGFKAQGSSYSPPIYRGNEPEPEPTILKAYNGNFELSNFGGLK